LWKTVSFALLWITHFPLYWGNCFITRTHTDAFEINKITRAEHLLYFWLQWDHPQTLYFFNAQQSDKSSQTANNTSHLSVQHPGIRSWLEGGNRVSHMFSRSLLHPLTMSDEIRDHVIRIDLCNLTSCCYLICVPLYTGWEFTFWVAWSVVEISGLRAFIQGLAR
jgi:hypothetical protein